MRDGADRAVWAELVALSEDRFRLLVESIRDYAIFMVDRGGRVASWNAGAELIKGYSADEVIGRHIETFYTPEARAAGRARMLLDQAAREGRIEDEGWRVRKDGTRFWADVVITAVRSPEGDVIGFGKVTRDLSERRAREEQMRQSEERLRLLIDSVRDYAIFMLDPGGHVATWNAGAERLKGYVASEIIGEHFSRFRRPDEVARGLCERELEIAASEGRFEDEGWRVRKDGTEFWASVTLTAMHDGDGRLLGYVKITRDLTDRRRAETERIRLAKAQEALRLRDEFLSIASHELKTPLTAMQLQLESLQEDVTELGDRIALKLARAARSGDRLSRLIDSLLDVSRIASGTFALQLEPVDLESAIRQVLETMRPGIERTGSRLTLALASPIVGHWDPLRIEQVLANLLSNAAKYGAGTPVEIAARQDGSDAVIEVSDRGPGIEEKDLERIFERFERAASMRHYGGLGLGLYVCRQIVAAHGGTITAANLPGGGARFTVRLPLLPRRAP